MINKRFLNKILVFVVTVFTVICFTACGKTDPGEAAWNRFVDAVNSGDYTGMGKAIYSSEADVEKYATDSKKADLFWASASGNIKTKSYKTTILCDFSNELTKDVYYGAEVKVTINGQDFDVNIYAYEGSRGSFLCSEPYFDENTGDFMGNVPSSAWYQKAYFTEKEYLYQIVPAKNANEEAVVTISQQNKNSKNVVIPEEINGMKVTTIAPYAYYKYNKILSFTTKASRMKTLELPNTITKIGEYAFYQCGNLEELSIPNSVNTIGAYAFSSCSDVETIRFNIDDSILYATEELIKCKPSEPEGTDYAIEITGGKVINAGDMLILTASAPMISPDRINWSSISADAITITTNASNQAIIYAKSSGSVTITATYKDNPSITCTVTLTIKSVTPFVKLNSTTFDRCYGLEKFYVSAFNPNSINISGDNVFLALSSDVEIWVPKGAKLMYQNHASWSKYADQIKELGVDDIE